ncbi:MAG: transposase [Imperialibacter sp.]|uniref:transposase n=1 Tax=Imperialibacter sp. TaxID=2038411 RepID=UPI0032F049B1
MSNSIFETPRNSKMGFDEVYFWTDTIKDWKPLLKSDGFNEIVINQLKWLVDKELICVYAFVLMPNHLHLIWEMLKFNGKEMPHASFNKWTSSQFLKLTRSNYPRLIGGFQETAEDRKHRFWQRDPLAVAVTSRQMFEQKMDYIHLNPLQEKWSLALTPEDYKWSSAKFYEEGIDEFGILTHYSDRF